MRLRIPVSLSLLLLASRVASAQALPADEFFHSGAQSYLTNNLARAREEVDQGLKLYPDDIKLKKLDELLKQQNQQQQSKDDQQKQEQKKDDQQKQQAKQDQKDQQKQPSEKQSQEQKQKQKEEQQAKSSGGQKGKEEKQEQGQPSQPMKAHAMTPQEAQQLLDAQKGQEQVLQFKPTERAERPARPIKDW